MSSPETANIDREVEMACVGTALISDRVIPTLAELGLRAHHFHYGRIGQTWDAILGLYERNAAVDVLTVAAEVERKGGVDGMSRDDTRAWIETLCAVPPTIVGAKGYAERVIELSQWRRRMTATFKMQEAVRGRDLSGWAHAYGELETSDRERRRDSLSPQDWAQITLDYLSQPKDEGFIQMPFHSLTQGMGGGLQPGELLLIAGYTSHGKSIMADMLLDVAAKAGMRAHLYMTEMTAAQRGLRYLARQLGIPYGKLRARGLGPSEYEKVMEALSRMPYGCTVASGWGIDEVVSDALRGRFDLVVIDLIHGFHYQDERELSYLSQSAMRLARVSTTRVGHHGTAVAIVAHLSDVQMRDSRSAKRPKPGMHSIKGSTSLKQDADFVMFVWQEDDEQGLPTGEGSIWIPKARSGENAAVNVRLNRARLRFEVAV